MGATALVASVPGSPLHPVLPPGVEPGGPFRWVADLVGLGDLRGSALVTASVAAVIASAVAFVFVIREAWRGIISLRTALLLAVGANVLVITLPLLVSRDVYSYIAYGTIAGLHHANPYVQTPIDFPGDPVAILVGPKWLATPAVYGPLFTGFASVVVRLVHSLHAQVEVFRWTALCACLGTIAVIATTVRRAWPARAAFAVAAFGMNPVVLFQSVASGHNDLLVALAVAGAFALVLSAAACRPSPRSRWARSSRSSPGSRSCCWSSGASRAPRPAAASARSSRMRGSPPRSAWRSPPRS